MKKYILSLVIILLALSSCASPADEATPDPRIAKGKRVFLQHCAACHATQPDMVIVGPSLARIATRGGETIVGLDTRAYIEQSILDPRAYLANGYQALMPSTFADTLSEQNIEVLMVYLMTLE